MTEPALVLGVNATSLCLGLIFGLWLGIIFGSWLADRTR